ncbi:MAG: DinB family protein [Terriglobales bacterium]
MGNRTLRELLHGERAHADPVACLKDIPAPLASRKVDGYPHSIWQITGHVNFWMAYELKRIAGESPVYPEHAIESWPSAAGPANEKEWQGAVAEFKTLLERLVVLSESSPDVLQRNVAGTHPSQESESSTVETVLWQSALHNSYHLGQIALLRRAFGAWPLRRGSDTW